MRIISQLGAEDNQIKKRSKKTKEDTFGMNDEDWNVYRDIVSEKCTNFLIFLRIGLKQNFDEKFHLHVTLSACVCMMEGFSPLKQNSIYV